jgi:hypothetical protein
VPKYLTTADWVERFRESHGDRYDYSKVETKFQSDPVIIVCSVHGEFRKTPTAHWKESKGCDLCVKDDLLRAAGIEMLMEFKKKHGNKFDYSQVIFTGRNNAVTIICPVHGSLSVAPANHLRSESGCRKCGHVEKLGTKPVRSLLTPIERFVQVHGNKYDYSKVVYVNNQKKITVSCPEHGDFVVSPTEHWKGSGCKTCNSKSIDAEECIRRFRKQHGDKFDYSRVDYISQTTAVTVVCPDHGEFSVQPVNHWKTQEGCKQCAYESRRFNSTQEIVDRFNTVHGDRYDYGNFSYSHMHAVSLISCKVHGDFPMSPANHLSDHGCPSCWQNNASKPETAWGEGISNLTGWELLQSRKVEGVRSVVDFICESSPHGRLALEYDGQYWHGQPDSLEKDTKKTKQLVDAGFKVIRLRVDDGRGRLSPLAPVPRAVNVFVPEMPDEMSLKLAVKEVTFALEELLG